MRIQFVTVPGSGKVLLCVSEVKAAGGEWDANADTLKGGLGVGAVFVTEEVVRFEPAQPEPEEPRLAGVGSVEQGVLRVSLGQFPALCSTCVRRPDSAWAASQDCGHV